MSNHKYKTSEQVCDAIVQGKVKRSSIMVMKRKAKSEGNFEYENILKEGVDKSDRFKEEKYHCSYYNKPIDELTLYELVELNDNKPELFTRVHTLRYSILMLGESESVRTYNRMIITPEGIKRYLEGEE